MYILQNKKKIGMKHYRIIYLFIVVLLLASCDIKKNNISPDASFVRVFESPYASDAYYPLSIAQTDDSGYLILSALTDSVNNSNFPKVELIYTSSQGSVLSSKVVDGYNGPVPGLMKIGNAYYFVCTNSTPLPEVMEVKLSGTNIEYTPKIKIPSGNGDLPLYSWNEGSNILLLAYDESGSTSVISKYANFSTNPVFSTHLEAKNQDFANQIEDHLQRTGTQMPFFGGNVGQNNGYFVNCLENYSLALIFLSESGSETGSLYSYQTNALSSALFLQSDTFAISRFYSGDNFVFPLVGLNRSSVQSADNFKDILISQLKNDAQTKVIKYNFNGHDLIVYASTTKSNQIVLLFFDAQTGKQLYTHYLGEGNPVEVIDLITTSDGGLAVLGKTWINQQYQRIILYKVDKDQLDIKLD